MDVLITRRRAFKSDSVVLVHKLYYKVLAGKRRAFKMQLMKNTERGVDPKSDRESRLQEREKKARLSL